tara:strand:+ start:592 stop:870 length:279 start_codon:yes stop_codon:yes gene_type:complete
MENEGQYSFIIPVLADSITTMTFVVPKEFQARVEMQALNVIDAFEKHPAAGMIDPNNKMMQAMSFIFQQALTDYLDYCDEEEETIPPDIGNI